MGKRFGLLVLELGVECDVFSGLFLVSRIGVVGWIECWVKVFDVDVY